MVPFLRLLLTDRVSGLLAVMLGLLLLGQALPYTVSAVMMGAGADRAALLRDGQPSSLADGIAQRRQAYQWFPDSRIAADIAALTLAQARAGQADWAVARQQLEEVAALRPLDGLNWARLAYVLAQGRFTPPPGPQAPVRAVLQSMAVGRFAPEYMDWRFIVAARLWGDMLAAQQDIVADQAGLMWHKKTRNFIRLARVPTLAAALEAMMIRYYPDEAAKFLQQRGRLRHTLPAAGDTP